MSSPNPRWLIRFESSTIKDEEVYEHDFVGPSDGKNSPTASDQDASSRRGVTAAARNNKKKSASSSNSDSDTSNNSKKKKVARTTSVDYTKENVSDDSSSAVNKQRTANIASSGDVSPTQSDDTNLQAQKEARLTAREARSRRRQAAIEDTKAAIANSSDAQPSRKRKLSGAAKQSAKNKREKQQNQEDCVKIKLLTGTLYLYRGQNRRAEFIRRVWNDACCESTTRLHIVTWTRKNSIAAIEFFAIIL